MSQLANFVAISMAVFISASVYFDHPENKQPHENLTWCIYLGGITYMTIFFGMILIGATCNLPS